jgi:hypothetical protein
LESAAEQAPRPYRFVLLSDHGQSGGATFKQRYGMTLEGLVQSLAETYRVQGDVDVHEDWSQVNVFLTEAANHDSAAVRRPMRRALKGRTQDDQVVLGPDAEAPPEVPEDAEDEGRIIVLASGNLGLVYGTTLGRRVTLEELESYFPGLLDGLVQHEGIGFAMVRSEEHGGVVIGAGGRYYLNEDRVEGENPLAGFGPRAAEHLRRTDSFVDAPDILVNSFYDADSNEVAAFEELIGNHGGLGGYQTEPFVMYPAEWELDGDELVGAEAVYRQFKRWLSQVQPQDVKEAEPAGA